MAIMIHVNTAGILASAEKLQSANDNIRDEFDNMTKEAISPLMRAWESPAASHAMELFYNIRNSYYNNRYTAMENYIRLLQQFVSAGYDEAERNNSSLSDVFK